MTADGGLYVPSELPALPPRAFDPTPISYADLAGLVLSPFFPGWEDGSLASILEAAYGAAAERPYFDLPEVAPLTPIGAAEDGRTRLYLLELFHGRTCAFKDMALSVLGGFLRESLSRMGRKEPVLVLTATSGDTGSAALEGLSAIEGVHTAVFYPQKGTSEIQRLQMTTAGLERRFVAGIEGNFDDAQNAVKRIFARAGRGEGPLASVRLSSANSINIGRLLPQIVYYVAAWRALASRGALGAGGLMHVAVPTGNFGDILAAKYAKEMGLPIDRLICASNANKVLADFFETGVYDRRRELLKTESPSMDILVSSNLERLLYMASGNDAARVSSLMGQLATLGWFSVDEAEKAYLADFSSGWCSDSSAKSAIAKVWESDTLLIDPHTATAVEVATRLSPRIAGDAPIVIASTASPFKFPQACLDALAYGEVLGGEVGGDLELAARLAAMTGCAMPGSIFSLASKKVLHGRMLPIDGVEEALGDYARLKFEG
jgi:threonine synthase